MKNFLKIVALVVVTVFVTMPLWSSSEIVVPWLKVLGDADVANNLTVGGSTTSASGTVSGDLTVTGDIYLGNTAVGDHDATIRFYDDGSTETLKWDDGNDQFEVSDDFRATGWIYAGGKILTGYPSSSWFSTKDIYMNADTASINLFKGASLTGLKLNVVAGGGALGKASFFGAVGDSALKCYSFETTRGAYIGGKLGIGVVPGTRALKVNGSVEGSGAFYGTTFAVQSSGSVVYNGDGVLNLGDGIDDKIYMKMGSGDSLAVLNSSGNQVFRLSPTGVGWFLGDLYAASYTDNTPICSPNYAWRTIDQIKSESYFKDGWGELDDSTLPGLMRVDTKSGHRRNMGAAISFNTAFSMEAKNRVSYLEKRCDAMEDKINFLISEIEKLKNEK